MLISVSHIVIPSGYEDPLKAKISFIAGSRIENICPYPKAYTTIKTTHENFMMFSVNDFVFKTLITDSIVFSPLGTRRLRQSALY